MGGTSKTGRLKPVARWAILTCSTCAFSTETWTRICHAMNSCDATLVEVRMEEMRMAGSLPLETLSLTSPMPSGEWETTVRGVRLNHRQTRVGVMPSLVTRMNQVGPARHPLQAAAEMASSRNPPMNRHHLVAVAEVGAKIPPPEPHHPIRMQKGEPFPLDSGPNGDPQSKML